MVARGLSYSVGNENSPADPWGRSDLVVLADGSARLDHHFSRRRGTSSWTGQVAGSAVGQIWAALDRAGFPELPRLAAVAPDTAMCRLTVEGDGAARNLFVARHHAAKLPGYSEAFGLLDAVIRQLSQDAVTYPAGHPPIVHDVRPASSQS
jgi:hypothetical protein